MVKGQTKESKNDRVGGFAPQALFDHGEAMQKSAPWKEQLERGQLLTGEPPVGYPPRNAVIEPYVPPQAIAKFLNLTRRRVLELTRRGILTGYSLGTGSRRVWRYKLSEIDAIVSGGSKKASKSAFSNGIVSSRISGGSPRKPE